MLMELVVVNVSLIIFLFFSLYKIEFYLVYYLIFGVCERVLGLGLLVQVIRFYGRDLYYRLNIGKF
jgi:hypothetical protein